MASSVFFWIASIDRRFWADAGRWELKADGKKAKPPALTGSSGAGGFKSSTALLVLTLLCLNDSRRNEEDQFLVGRIHLHVLEQVAQHRKVAQHRHLRDVD